MKAVILAAGEGKRLRPFTETIPKVMLPVANKPVLEYVIDAVKNNGINEIKSTIKDISPSKVDFKESVDNNLPDIEEVDV